MKINVSKNGMKENVLVAANFTNNTIHDSNTRSRGNDCEKITETKPFQNRQISVIEWNAAMGRSID